MLKLSGAILCIAGFTGYGMLKITGWKQALQELNQWLLIFQKIRSRLFYQKETLEESCLWIGEREESDLGKIISRIGERARVDRQTEFSLVWKEEVGAWSRQSMLPLKSREMLQRFPEYVKEADEELQMNLFTLYMEELKLEKADLEKQIQEKQKPILAVSLIGGVMISILLV